MIDDVTPEEVLTEDNPSSTNPIQDPEIPPIIDLPESEETTEEEPITPSEPEQPIEEETPPEPEGPKWYEYENANDVNFIGTKFIKPDYDFEAYAAVAAWCNETQKAYITESDDGTYYECVAIPEPPIEILKEIKLAQLEREFNNAVKGSFVTEEGYNMQFDETDCNKMNGAITLNEALGIESDYLVQADNTVLENVPMSTMKNVLLQMLRQYKSMHLKKQVFRAQINNCTTKEELDNIILDF